MAGAERLTKAFKTQAAFEAWLEKHHARTDGIWMRYYKKASGKPTVSYAEALEVALCYGWIDGQRKSDDDVSFLQLYTPRRTARSMPSTARNSPKVLTSPRAEMANATGSDTCFMTASPLGDGWRA